MKALCAVVLALGAVAYAQDPKPIFDGRLSLKPTALSAAEQSLLKDRILPAARKAWQSRRECDPATAAAVDVAPGSFTRPKSDQRAILYTYCAVGHNMALNGIAVIENGAVIAHVVYEGGNERAIGALPDIDGNGLSEIVVATGGTNQGVTWDAISILELNGATVAAFGQTQVRTDDCGIDENHCAIEASRISVKAGSAPTFFRELFVDSGDGIWRKSGTRTAITLEKGKSEYVLLK